MDPYNSKESRYLVKEAAKGLSRHNLERMIEQLQNEVSHNYLRVQISNHPLDESLKLEGG